MATRYLSRPLFTATKQFIISGASRSSTAFLLPNSPTSLLSRVRPLFAASCLRHLSPVCSTRGFSSSSTTVSVSLDGNQDPNAMKVPLRDGCDLEHWIVLMKKPKDDATRAEIVNSYIKTLAIVLGSEEEARMKMYSVYTMIDAFGANISEKLTSKLTELPEVRGVLPDSYTPGTKKYAGEPYFDGKPVLDPMYLKYQQTGDLGTGVTKTVAGITFDIWTLKRSFTSATAIFCPSEANRRANEIANQTARSSN